MIAEPQPLLPDRCRAMATSYPGQDHGITPAECFRSLRAQDSSVQEVAWVRPTLGITRGRPRLSNCLHGSLLFGFALHVSILSQRYPEYLSSIISKFPRLW